MTLAASRAGSLPVVDYHVHTARCGHATGTMEQYVERAIEAGLQEIGFSDHLYLYWLNREQRDPELGMADWELDFYIEDVERCRVRYRDDIIVRLSTEADYIPGQERTLEAILKRYDWDYIVGSVHFVDGWGMDDSRNLSGYDRWDIDSLYARYFELVAEAAETGFFDTIGHADLVKKFGHRPSEPLDVGYAELAKRLGASGVAVEVNTAGLRKPCAEMYPNLALLSACREQGVPTTFASDAHAAADVAADFSRARELMLEAGYSSYLRFAGRQRCEEPLLLPSEAASQSSKPSLTA